MQEPQQPAAAAADTAAAAEVAPPTIDSHGGKLTPMTACYADGATSFLMLAAMLSALSPRRLSAFGWTADLGWTRLVPGLLVCAIAAWNLAFRPITLSYPGMVADQQARTILIGALLAFAFLNLLADALIPRTPDGTLRSVAGVGSSALGLLLLLALFMIDWFGAKPTLSIEPIPVLIWTLGVPAGVGLLLLWRHFDGRLFDLIVLFGTVATLVLSGALPGELQIGALGFHLVAFTVAATLGAGLRGMGATGSTHLNGWAAWVWAWLLRAGIVAVLASC